MELRTAMRTRTMVRRAAALIIVGVLCVAGTAACGGLLASSDEIRVMISGGFAAAYLEVVPEFERATGNKDQK